MKHAPVTRPAHAKINLGLEILRRREDGYHDLETVFCPIGLSDSLTFDSAHKDLKLTVAGGAVPADDSNLCLRAARALLPYAQKGSGVHITLEKRIPVGAGLGGGSSDAACVLTTLNELWHLSLTREKLRTIASQLGADVAYFLDGGLAVGAGIGDRLERIGSEFPYWIVVVVPPEHVSTAWAYGRLTIDVKQEQLPLKQRFLENLNDLTRLNTVLRNDFEPVVIPAHPAIGEVRNALTEAGLKCVRMSGSGSAVFGLSHDPDVARWAATIFPAPFITSLTPPRMS